MLQAWGIKLVLEDILVLIMTPDPDQTENANIPEYLF